MQKPQGMTTWRVTGDVKLRPEPILDRKAWGSCAIQLCDNTADMGWIGVVLQLCLESS